MLQNKLERQKGKAEKDEKNRMVNWETKGRRTLLCQ